LLPWILANGGILEMGVKVNLKDIFLFFCATGIITRFNGKKINKLWLENACGGEECKNRRGREKSGPDGQNLHSDNINTEQNIYFHSFKKKTH
jgi:hypothetical protein